MNNKFGVRFGLTAAAATLAAISTFDPVTIDPVAAAEFRDTNGHWAEDYIESLSDMGVLGGFPDGSFRPNAPVTRAQFATIANKVFQLDDRAIGSPFRDVPNSHWAASNIAAANSSGLVAGFPDGRFQPEQNVTRGQSLVVMVNGLQAPTIPAANVGGWLQPYRDADTVPAWAAPGLATAAQLDLPINYPDPSWLEPNRPATRGEVAAFAYRTLSQMGSFDFAAAPRDDTTASSRSSPQQLAVQLSSYALAGTPFAAINPGDRASYFSPKETHPFSLVTNDSIRTESGTVAIPYGSRIDGWLEPAPGGLRFVAERVTIDNDSYPLAARSAILNDVKDPRQTRTVNVVGDAAIGAAAGAVLAGVTGDRAIATEEVLAGAAAGAAIGNIVAPRVVQIGPEDSLELRLTQDFVWAGQ